MESGIGFGGLDQHVPNSLAGRTTPSQPWKTDLPAQAPGRSAWVAVAHSVDILRRKQRAAVDRHFRAADEAIASV